MLPGAADGATQCGVACTVRSDVQAALRRRLQGLLEKRLRRREGAGKRKNQILATKDRGGNVASRLVPGNTDLRDRGFGKKGSDLLYDLSSRSAPARHREALVREALLCACLSRNAQQNWGKRDGHSQAPRSRPRPSCSWFPAFPRRRSDRRNSLPCQPTESSQMQSRGRLSLSRVREGKEAKPSQKRGGHRRWSDLGRG